MHSVGNGVLVSLTYNNSRIAGTDEFGDPYYLIKGASAVNTGDRSYRIVAKQDGVQKFIYILEPGTDVSTNLPAAQQWTTINSEVAVSLI